MRNYGAGQDDASGLHYLVLEYVDGPSAHDLLERFGRLKLRQLELHGLRRGTCRYAPRRVLPRLA